MIQRRRRWILIVSVFLLAGALLAVPAIRTPILRSAGWALVVDQPVEPADAVVVAIDADGAGVLEAADLVRSGIATRVAVFSDPPDAVDREFIRRGLSYEDAAEQSIRQLKSLGVAAVERITRPVLGTEDQGHVLLNWCDEQRFRSVVLVTTSDHSRRLHRVIRRAMKGHQTRVVVRVARYSHFDPDRWWHTRAGIRIAIIELEKLLLDFGRHPIS